MSSSTFDNDHGISADQPDWSREKLTTWWSPSRQLLKHLRGYHSCIGKGWLHAKVFAKWHALWHRFWSVVTGADIPLTTHIEGGLLLPHPNGVVVHSDSRIGPNCLLFQQVTLGDGGTIPGVPVLGGHVDVGAGAKILGGVHIGNHARIGANAVVLCDVPEGHVAVGVPARVLLPKTTQRTEEDYDKNEQARSRTSTSEVSEIL